MKTKMVAPWPVTEAARPVGGEVARVLQEGGWPKSMQWAGDKRDKSRRTERGDYEGAPDVWMSSVRTTGWLVRMLRLAGWNVEQVVNALEDLNNVGGAWMRFKEDRGVELVRQWCAGELVELSTDESRPRKRANQRKEWQPVHDTSKAKFLLWIHESGGLKATDLYQYPYWRGTNAKGVIDGMKRDLLEQGHLVTHEVHNGKRGRPPKVHTATGSGISWAREQVAESERRQKESEDYEWAVKQWKQQVKRWHSRQEVGHPRTPFPPRPVWADGAVIWPDDAESAPKMSAEELYALLGEVPEIQPSPAQQPPRVNAVLPTEPVPLPLVTAPRHPPRSGRRIDLGAARRTVAPIVWIDF